MKKLVCMLAIMFMLTGCGKTEVVVQEKIRAVKTETIVSQLSDVTVDYIGTVESEDLTKYSFKSSGKLASIYVKKGEVVDKGDKLVELDKSDLKLQLATAENQMKAAKSQYTKALNGATSEEKTQVEKDVETAKKAFEVAEKSYEDMKKLHAKGAVSDSQLDSVELQYTQAKNNYAKAREGLKRINDGARDEDIDAAKSNYEAAKAGYELRKSLYDDGAIYAKAKGAVVEIPFEKNELVPQGHPAVIVRSKTQVVNVGIAQKDLDKVKLGTKADIILDGEVAKGVITNIAEAPDTYTRTYNAEVLVEDKEYRLGSIVKVSFYVGEEDGIWVPSSSVASNGIDYVYVVKDGRAVKNEIVIEKMYNDKVKVSGLNDGDKLVTEGVKNISDGIKVNIVGIEVADEKPNKELN
ncbi:MAG: HlyD family efflux transporter periplasmic adaptor subunit [Clostridia bacterium]|jgi:multidrug efflux pump subunit AcrA (membrane-fusion protein)|nr:HlyD family efflux transporter periplasmic adaptor subunit [Clostridia bacterium]